MTTESTLKAIDAAMDGLCVCGCGRHLDPKGGSGWRATETCQEVWQLAQVRPKQAGGWQAARLRQESHRRRLAFQRAGYPMSHEDAEQAERKLRGVLAEFGRAAEEWCQLAAAAVEACARELAPLVEQLQQAGAVEQEPPTDPRERALWLRRNRNTGPKERGRWSPRAQARESRRKP